MNQLISNSLDSTINNRFVSLVMSLLIIAAMFPSFCLSQDEMTFLSPGFRVGYRFGEQGGMAGGPEVSVTRWNGGHYVGALISVDNIGKRIRVHVAFETGSGFFGCSVGPTFAFGAGSPPDYGFRVTPYAGFLLIPYYSFLYMRSSPSEHEVGSFIKVPVNIGGKEFRLVD
jgi:hypothetical protein